MAVTSKSPMKIVECALDHGFKSVSFHKQGSGVEIDYTGTKSAKHAARESIPNSALATWQTLFESWSFFWPEPSDSLGKANRSQRLRILCAPLEGSRWIADFVQKGDRGFLLENISGEHILPALEWLTLSPHDRKGVERIARAPSGLVICNNGTARGQVDGEAAVLALHPDATVYLDPKPSDIKLAVEQADSQLVALTFSTLDAVENILSARAAIQSDPELALRFDRALLCSFVYHTVHRPCPACSEPASMDSESLARLPESIVPKAGATYQRGRGCLECDSTGYRGTAGIATVCTADDKLRELLRSRSPAEALVEEAYRSGTRSFLEDGLEKVLQGNAAFNELLDVTGGVLPPTFLKAASGTHRRDEPRWPEKEPVVTTTKTNGGRPRMLIAEDDHNQRGILKIIFEDAGYDVTTAQNGRYALEALHEGAVDVLLCDLMMPEVSGIQVLEEVRKDPVLRHLPILMLTAADSPDNEFDLLDKGADDFCPKTVQKKVLIKRVEKLLKARKMNPLGHMLAE